MLTRTLVAALAISSLSCGGADERPVPGRPAPVEPFDDDRSGVSQAAGKPADPAPVVSTSVNQDGPHISRSVGEEGGLIVFWPRIIPQTDDPKIHGYAKQLQQRLVAIGSKKYEGKLDMRPEPERVCPQAGCRAATLGVLLTHRDGGCTATALIAKPGKSPTRLIPWAGVLQLKSEQVPFREYPETQLTIRDAVPCKDLLDALGEKEPEIAAAL